MAGVFDGKVGDRDQGDELEVRELHAMGETGESLVVYCRETASFGAMNALSSC